jgi:hypothetical protein
MIIQEKEQVQKLTKEQAAIIGAYTGITCGSFSDIHKLAEKLLERPIFTHEFANKVFNNELKEKVKPLFLELCYEDQFKSNAWKSNFCRINFK